MPCWKLSLIFHFPLSQGSFRWSRQNLQACDSHCEPCNHRATAAELRKPGLKTPKWTEKKKPTTTQTTTTKKKKKRDNFKVKTGSRTRVYQLLWSCLLLWSVTQQNKGVWLHGETESTLWRTQNPQAGMWPELHLLPAGISQFYRDCKSPPCSTGAEGTRGMNASPALQGKEKKLAGKKKNTWVWDGHSWENSLLHLHWINLKLNKCENTWIYEVGYSRFMTNPVPPPQPNTLKPPLQKSHQVYLHLKYLYFPFYIGSVTCMNVKGGWKGNMNKQLLNHQFF